MDLKGIGCEHVNCIELIYLEYGDELFLTS